MDPNTLYNQKNWFALRTRSRHEKAVRDRLISQGIEQLLPTTRCRTQWTDRKKLVELPLFPGYCFARFAAQEQLCVLQVPGVSYIVSNMGKPQSIPQDEIEELRKLMASGVTCEPDTWMSEGTQVEIIRGHLSGLRGHFIRRAGQDYVFIGVRLIQQAAVVKINAADVVPIEGQARNVDPQVHSSPHLVA